jgi:hypothetical protein
MNAHPYTPIRVFKKQNHFFHFVTSNFEPFMLSMLVVTGIIGSVYLFGQKIILGEGSSTLGGSPTTSSIASIFTDKEDTASSDLFDDYVKIADSRKAGQPLEIEFLKDPKSSRYVMEMGDGVRLIVTQQKLIYTYEAPGKYVLELKEIKNGLLTVVGSKKIKIK